MGLGFMVWFRVSVFSLLLRAGMPLPVVVTTCAACSACCMLHVALLLVVCSTIVCTALVCPYLFLHAFDMPRCTMGP